MSKTLEERVALLETNQAKTATALNKIAENLQNNADAHKLIYDLLQEHENSLKPKKA
jgi:hypothetical protein